MGFPTKVKKIRIRAADGTETSPIPLTTDYEYIDVASQGKLTTLDKALLDGAPAALDLTETSLYELVITSNQQTKEEVNSALNDAKGEIDVIKQETVASKTAAEAAQKAAEEAAASINTDLSSYWTSAEVQEYVTETEENTTYTLEYEKGAGRLVLTPSTGAPQYIDVSDFIKDGMLQDVQYNPITHVLTLIWNTTIDEDNKIEINLSDLIDVVPTLVSELENDVGYITIEALTDGGYLTKTAADDVYATQDALDITNSNIIDAQNDINNLENRFNDLTAQGGEPNAINVIKVNGQAQPINVADNKSVNIIVPVTVSELTNDAGFISSIPTEYVTESELSESLESYVTNSTLEGKKYATKATTLQGYGITDAYTKAEIDATISAQQQAIDNAVLINTEQSNDIAAIEQEIWGVDNTGASRIDKLENAGYITGAALEGYAQVTDIPIKVSELENDANYITSIPDEYITEEELNPYATKTYVDEAIKSAELGGSGTEVDLSEYAKISWVEEQNTALKTEIENKGYITLSDTDGRYVQPADLDEYALDTDVTAVGEIASAAKSTADTAASNITTLTGRVEALEGQDVGEDNLIEVVSVNGVNQPIVDKTINITIPTKLSEFEEDVGIQELKQDVTQLQEDLEGIVSEGGEPNKINKITVNGVEQTPDANKVVNITVPTKTSDLTNDSNFITLEDVPEPSAPDLSNYYTKEEVNTLVNTLDERVDTLETNQPNLENYYTKSEIDDKLSEIEAGEGVDLTNYYTKAEIDNMLANVQPTIETATDEDIDALFL